MLNICKCKICSENCLNSQLLYWFMCVWTLTAMMLIYAMYNVLIPDKKCIVWRQIAILNYPCENKLIRKGDKDDRGSKMSLCSYCCEIVPKMCNEKKRGSKIKSLDSSKSDTTEHTNKCL